MVSLSASCLSLSAFLSQFAIAYRGATHSAIRAHLDSKTEHISNF
jgi:hypothetical protein